jgi:glycosyltransferase involved in cell wall biosynthesis
MPGVTRVIDETTSKASGQPRPAKRGRQLLPPPPPGKTGWPWTACSEDILNSRRDGSPLPTITIVTPSFNQARFLEETIRSVLLQGYPNLEYFVYDGGSRDESCDIIQKYAPWINYWECRSDRGQAHAINKGLVRAGGEIISWLNSDDIFTPGSLFKAAERINPSRMQLLVGGAGYIDATSQRLSGAKQRKGVSLCNLIYDWWALPQPACFWTRSAQEGVGLLDERLHYTMDRELFVRMYLRGVERLFCPDEILALERRHAEQKTQSVKHVYDEYAAVLRRRFPGWWYGGLFRAGLAAYPRWQGVRALKFKKALTGHCAARQYMTAAPTTRLIDASRDKQ